MAGEKLKDLPPINLDIDYIAVKEAVFPFDRFPGVDPVLSPEMKSTGEVMGIDRDFATAFAKSQIGARMPPPMSGKLFVSVKDTDKPVIVPAVRQAIACGFGSGGDVTIFVHNDNGRKSVDSARIDKTVPLVYSMSGETFEVGVDTGSPVGPYPHGFDCTAKIHSVVVERLDEPPAEIKQKMREGEFRASLSTQ
jgi:hypothetical protein